MCDVCYGTPGRYPIIDRFGSELYTITCPECRGLGDRDYYPPRTLSAQKQPTPAETEGEQTAVVSGTEAS